MKTKDDITLALLKNLKLFSLNEADEEPDSETASGEEIPDEANNEEPQPEDVADTGNDNPEEPQPEDPNENIDEGDPNAEGEGDPNQQGEGEEETPPSPTMIDPESNLNLQKYQLFQNYQTVYNTCENLLEIVKEYPTSDLDDNQYKIYQNLLDQLKTCKADLFYTMNDVFQQLEYSKLLKVFIFNKGSLKIITALLKNIFNCENN